MPVNAGATRGRRMTTLHHRARLCAHRQKRGKMSHLPDSIERRAVDGWFGNVRDTGEGLGANTVESLDWRGLTSCVRSDVPARGWSARSLNGHGPRTAQQKDTTCRVAGERFE